MSAPHEKSLPLAIGLNLVLPGAGYMYMGRVIVGAGAVLIVSLILIASGAPLLVPIWLGINLIMAIDMWILFNRNKTIFQASTTRRCPHCAELIQVEARICKHCQRDVVIAHA